MITFSTDGDVILSIDINNVNGHNPDIKIKIEGSYIKYSTSGELMEQKDLAVLLGELGKLLEGRIKRTTVISSIESDLYFKLYPLVASNPYIEMSICFWTEDGGMGGNTFTMSLCGEEVVRLRDYLFDILND